MEHPISDASLERFARGVAPHDEGRAVLAHLLRGCSLCSRKLHTLAGLARPADAGSPSGVHPVAASRPRAAVH
jgi:hypothetical protein